MRLAALCLLLLSLSFSLCPIPEINIAASAPVLNQEIAKNLGPLIVQQVVNHTMNQTFVEEMSFGVVHVNISLSNLTVTELDINWKTNILVPKGDYTFRVNFKDITVALASDIKGHVSLKKIDTNLTVELSRISGYADFRLAAPKSAGGVGFSLQVAYIEVEVAAIDINFRKDVIDTFVAQTVASLLRKSLPKIINSVVQEQVNPLLDDFCNSRAFVTQEIGNHLYEISLATSEVPRFIDLAYLAVPLDVVVYNVDTGRSNDEVDNDHLPLKPFDKENDTLEVTLSSGMVNTLLWLVQDASLVDLYVDDSALGDSSPISLNTTDLKILLPEMAKVYGAGHGVYLHVTMSTKVPGLFIRGGRLLVSTAVNIEFIVDRNDALYPRNVTECLALGECLPVVTLNSSLIASAALKINSQNRLFATIQTVKIVDAKVVLW